MKEEEIVSGLAKAAVDADLATASFAVPYDLSQTQTDCISPEQSFKGFQKKSYEVQVAEMAAQASKLQSPSPETPVQMPRPAPINTNYAEPARHGRVAGLAGATMASPMASPMGSPMAGGYMYGQPEYQSPVLQSQLAQMQNQISMMSQLALANNRQVAPVPDQSAASQRDSMLCFTLGERIGALHKHEEATKDDMAALKKGMEENMKDIYEMRSKVVLCESGVAQEHEATVELRGQCKALASATQDQANMISRLAGDVQHEKSSVKSMKQAMEAKLSDLAKSCRQYSAAITDMGKDMLRVENSNEKTSSEQAKLQEQLKSIQDHCMQIAERLQAQELHSSRDRDQHKRRNKELDEALRSQKAESQKQTRALERHTQELVQQHADHLQQQLQALRSDLSSLSPTIHQLLASGAASQGMAGPVTMFALQALLPFLSSERLSGIGSWLASMYRKDWSLLPHLRSVWCAILLCDMGMRVLDWYFPWISATITPVLHLNVLSGNTLMVIRILRVILEVGLLVQLVVSVFEAWQRLVAYVKHTIQQKFIEAKALATSPAGVATLCAVPVASGAILLFCYKKNYMPLMSTGAMRALPSMAMLPGSLPGAYKYVKRTAGRTTRPLRAAARTASSFF